jgi:NADH-quinone oxidoreductase subunit B
MGLRISGGMFNNYAIVGRRPRGAGRHVPAGCPPRPEMLIDAILKLREKIMAEPLGANGRKMLQERVERGEVSAVAPGAMPSSYRSDPDRRRQWEKAVREGREEQLRIENWMKDGRHLQQGGRW